MRLGRLAFAGLMLSVGTALAATGDALIVTGDRVNVRFGPGTDAGIKMRVHRNQQVTELERQGEWVRAEIAGTGGEEGWIHGSLLEARQGRAAPAPEPPSEVAARAPEAAEPAAGRPLDLAGLDQFRESVEYLNSRAQAVAGVELFTGVEAASEDVVQVTATEAWASIPPAGQQSYLNTLVDRWAAAKGGSPASVQIVDAGGDVVMEKSGP